MNDGRKCNYVIAASTQDPAGLNLSSSLITLGSFQLLPEFDNKGKMYKSRKNDNVTLHLSSDSVLEMDYLDDVYSEAEVFVFLSKHKSESSIPTMTCHSVGNFLDNPYGGNPQEMGIAFPSLQKEYMINLSSRRNEVPGYEMVIEATHHGPTSLKKPVIFIELGSSDSHWSDKNAASIICSTLLTLIEGGPKKCEYVGIGLGGTHYPAKFNKLLLETGFGLAAVASKHVLQAIDEEMFQQMISKSTEQVTHVIIDSKGLGEQKTRIMQLAQRSGLQVVFL